MRKVTKDSVNAFIAGKARITSNTAVRVLEKNEAVELYLFGHLIAYRDQTGVYISNAGWTSNTTKERLNAVIDAYGKEYKGIIQRKWKWYLIKDWTDKGEEFPNNQFIKIA